jgi:hypothetical protein
VATAAPPRATGLFVPVEGVPTTTLAAPPPPPAVGLDRPPPPPLPPTAAALVLFWESPVVPEMASEVEAAPVFDRLVALPVAAAGPLAPLPIVVAVCPVGALTTPDAGASVTGGAAVVGAAVAGGDVVTGDVVVGGAVVAVVVAV